MKEKKEIQGFDCEKYNVYYKEKLKEVFSTKSLGLRYAKNFNLEGFILEYPGYSKKFGHYTAKATKIKFTKIPERILSLKSFKILTPKDNKKYIARYLEAEAKKAEKMLK